MTDKFKFMDAAISWGESDRKDPKPFHYFASSAANWAVDEDLGKCLSKIRRADKTDGRVKVPFCWVWRVPVPKSEPYEIDLFTPQVEGAEFVDYVYY